MNDLAYAINESSLLSLADDTNLHASNECPRAVENMIKQDLFNATPWFKQNGMKINFEAHLAVAMRDSQCSSVLF